MKIQFLKNLDGYKPPAFMLPVVMFDMRLRALWPWVAVIFCVGFYSFGVRLYIKTTRKWGEK